MSNTSKTLAMAALAGLLTVGFTAVTTSFAYAGEHGDKGAAMEKAAAEKNACKGHNSCKGNGGCKTGDNGCKGKNSCKGKGGCATDGSKSAE
ncbi:MAG: hypothetical protein EBX50_13525 [Chitinophagia bacterium]|nr:hypothetical protein [Chitinophagia bacterium]